MSRTSQFVRRQSGLSRQEIHLNEAPGLITAGRGWEEFKHPVFLEPQVSAYVNRKGVTSVETAITDDGRYPNLLERFFRTETSRCPASTAAISYVQPRCQETTDFSFVELQVSLPQTSVVKPEVMERLLLNLANRVAPTAFEIIANEQAITVQFAVREVDAEHAELQLKSHFPEATVLTTDAYLKSVFQSRDSNSPAESRPLIVQFGLRRECMHQLRVPPSFEPDALIGLISSMSDLGAQEKCVVQVLFQAPRERWSERFVNVLTTEDGSPRFQESRDLLTAAKQKFSQPVLAVAIRCGVKASSEGRALQIARGLAGTFETLACPNGNDLIALRDDEQNPSVGVECLINRSSYRSGMLLNVAELAALAHLPSASVKNAMLRREELRTKRSPTLASGRQLVLGVNTHQGISRTITLSNQQRTRHAHLIGSSGSGKSTLMLKLIEQDLQNGAGMCVIDPHGDLIDSVIANVPDKRIEDVILFDPSDEFPIGFNILQAKSTLEKNLLSSDLVATFRRMATSWGDVMDSVLANAILAFLESSRGGNLLDFRRFLVEPIFRNEFLESVNDDGVVYFWEHEFPLIAGKPQASILIRLDAFLRQGLIRNIVCQSQNKLDFRAIMDSRKVLLVKLSQGLIGEENAYLLGTMLVSRIYQSALSRQDSHDRPFFWLYMDEFHHFITPSMERILSGTRKYNLGLILAHQEFRQMQSRSMEVASSVLSNCFTRVCFRLGDNDAEKFAGGFSFFDAKALQNLGVGEAIARIERADYDFNMTVEPLPTVSQEMADQRRNKVLEHSRSHYGRRKAEVEAELRIVRKNVSATKDERPELSDIKAQPRSAKEKRSDAAVGVETTEEHRYLQSLLKRIGENKGFVTTIEKPVFGGIGRVDVALESEDFRIACEVAVTNTTEYETQNIQKCLSSGFDRMVVVSTNTRHLQNIRKRAELVLSPVHFSRVYFLEPENFHLFLESLETTNQTSHRESSKIKGYTIRTTVNEGPPEEQATKSNIISDVLSRALRRKKGSENE